MNNPLTRALATVTDTLRSYWLGPISSRDPALANWFGGGPTSTGINVTTETAYNSSAFWSAVAIVSGDVASVPLELIKRSAKGDSEPFVDSKTYQLVHDTPNPEMTSLVFREALQSHVLTWGNAYAEIERDGMGRPKALWPLTPDRVVPFRNSRGDVQYRVINVGQTDSILDASDVVHVPGLGFDGLMGYSVIDKARESIGMGLAMQKFGGTFFGNGSTFGGVLSTASPLTQPVKQSIRESIDAVHTGVDRAHKFVILGNGFQYTKLGIPPNDAQFLESRRFEIEEMARWFHMPQHKLNGLDHATFSNIEHLDLEYYKGCLRGWYVRWEQELNRKLISPLERRQQSFRHNVEGFLRGDSASRTAFYQSMFSIGVFSQNMILEKENLNGIGPDGDTHYVAANMMPIERAIRPPEPPPVATVTDVTPPAEPKALPPKRDDALETELRAQLADAERRVEAHLAAAAAADVDAERWKDSATTFQAEAEQERAGAVTAGEEARGLRTALEQEHAALETAEATAKAAQDAHRTAEDARTAAETARREAEAARDETARGQAALAERLTVITTAAVTATEAVKAQKAAELARLTAVLGAHRALIVDAMGRMVRRETEKARRHQGSAEKLRAWADAFYLTHEDMCVDALRPAIRVHLAWQQSTEDADTVTRAYVRTHIAESVMQLRSLDGIDAEDLSPVLERLLARWETQRPDALADQILKEEVAYVRSR